MPQKYSAPGMQAAEQFRSVPVGKLLPDRTAIVTGGGTGMGRGIADAFADHGANVVVADINEALANEAADAIRGRGGAAIAIAADVRLREDCERIIATARAELGPVRVLVNNVGHPGARDKRPFYETTEEAWDAIHAMNFRHILLMTRAAVPHMIEAAQGGSIINVTTVEAHRGIPYLAVYGAYKAAVSHFTKSMAVDLGRYGIRVNELAPDMNEELHQQRLADVLTRDELETLPLYIPLGRMGTAADSGGVAVFLASDLSAYVTGDCIHQSGGTLAASGWYRATEGRRQWSNTPRVI